MPCNNPCQCSASSSGGGPGSGTGPSGPSGVGSGHGANNGGCPPGTTATITDAGSHGCAPPATASPSSGSPVRYATGEIGIAATDIVSNGFGIPWGHTRSFASVQSVNETLGQGFCWKVSEWSYLIVNGFDGSVVIQGGPNSSLWFTLSNAGCTFPVSTARETLVLDTKRPTSTGSPICMARSRSTTAFPAPCSAIPILPGILYRLQRWRATASTQPPSKERLRPAVIRRLNNTRTRKIRLRVIIS